MANIFKRLSQAMAILDLFSIQLPVYTSDGEITIDEMSELIKQLARILNIKLKIKVPESLSGTKLPVEKS